MKKILAFLLIFCLFLCPLSGCGEVSTEGEDSAAEGENGGSTMAPDLSATSRELISKLHVTSSYTREGKTTNEEMLMNYTWTATGAVMEGYELDSDGKDIARMEITFDDQKRPVKMVRSSHPVDEEPEESTVIFDYSVKGQVKLLNDGFGDGEQYVIYEYDDNGRVTREEYPNYTRFYEYDAQGNCTRKRIDHKTEDVEDTEYKTVYTYGADGKAVSGVQTSSTGEEMQLYYSYYPNGNVMWVAEVSSHGYVNMNLRPYNMKDIGWDKANQATANMEYEAPERDAQGRVIKVAATIGHSGERRVATIAYDEQGRVVAHETMHGAKYHWEYDAQGRLVKETNVTDYSTATTTYTYDDKGRMTQEKRVDSRGTGHTYTREYNDEGMTIKMVEENVYSDSASTTTAVMEYVTNAECQVSDAWAALLLNFFTVVV